MASKTNLPSLIDMVLEDKLGRTNLVADALSRKAELAAFKCEAVAADDCWSRLPERIVFEMGLKKDPREAFCTKLRNAKVGLDQLWALGHKRESTFLDSKTFFFRYAAPRARSAPQGTSGAKTKPGEFFSFLGGNPFLVY
jgi:hypothetical protein